MQPHRQNIRYANMHDAERMHADDEACPALSDTEVPPVRVAHCIAGAIGNARPSYSQPLTSPNTWKALTRWLQALRRVQIVSGVYIVLDITQYPPRPRAPAKNGTRTTRTIDILRSEEFPPQTALPRIRWPDNASALEALSAHAEHVQFEVFQPGVCRRLASEYATNGGRLSCTCGSIAQATFPRFWEALGKHARCLEMLHAHESSRGARYDFVTKLRPDPNLAAEFWMAPGWLRHAFMLDGSHRTVIVAPWINSHCYSWSDWFTLMPRGLARRVLNVTHELTCEWLACAEKVYGAERAVQRNGGACLYNERLLVEWVLGGRTEEHADARTSAATTGAAYLSMAIRATPLPKNSSLLWCAHDVVPAEEQSARAKSETTASTGEGPASAGSKALPFVGNQQHTQHGYSLPSWLSSQNAFVARGVGRDVRAKLHASDDARRGALSSQPGTDPRYRRWHRPKKQKWW